MGGFSGDELGLLPQGDVNPLETIISGDVRHSLYWVSGTINKGSVWNYETTPPTLNEPESELTIDDKFWRPNVKNFTDNTPYGISNSTPATSQELYGFSTASASDLVLDAFGYPRKLNGYPIGPLNPPSAASVIKIH